MTSNGLEHALAYARMGYPVFPLSHLSKKPLPGSKGFLDASTNLAIVQMMFRKVPQANVGIATAGLVVFDKDPDGDDWMMENWDSLENAPRQTTPRKGCHFIFNQNGEPVRSRGGAFHGIDIRADGGYIVAPPSYVIDEKCNGSYQWVEGYELPPREKLPIVPTTLADQLREAKERKGPQPNENKKIPRSGRHDYIRGRIMDFKEAHMPPKVAKELARHIDQTMCDPPLSSERNFEAELDRMVKWVYQEGPAGLPAGVAPEIDNWVADSILRNIKHEDLVHADEHIQAVARAKQVVQQDKMPAELFHELPPVATDAFNYYRDGFAYKVQPELWLGSFIALTSSLIAHQVYLPDGTRSNIYCIGAAGTGRGKDATRLWGKRLLNRFGKAGMVDMGRITSMSGILTTVANQNPVCLCPDEFGMVISQAIAPGKDNRYAETIVIGLLELYTASSDTHYQMTAYADAKKRHAPVSHPCMSMWAVSTPKTLWHNMSPAAIEAGLIPRFMFFGEDQDPAEQTPDASLEPSDRLIEWIQQWLLTNQNLLEQSFGHGKPAVVTEGAQELIVAFRRQCESLIDDEKPETLVWSRAAQNASKLALIFATWKTTDHTEGVAIDAQAANWAIRMTEHSMGGVLKQIGEFMADSPADRACQRFLSLLRKHAGEDGWCPRRDIQTRMARQQFNEALQWLLKLNEVEFESRATKTKPALYYREVPDGEK